MKTIAAERGFGDAGLQGRIHRLRGVDDARSWWCLAREYACLALVIGAAAAWSEGRRAAGLPWPFDVPAMGLAVLLVGGLQHRLAALGHEAAHYTLLRRKWLNDVVGDMLCLFPIFSTVHLYRLAHFAHHQYTNDPERDPNVVDTGAGKGIDDFPMPAGRFAARYWLGPLTRPRSFVRYLRDYARTNVFGSASSPYLAAGRGVVEGPTRRVGTALGVLYLLGFVALQWWLTTTGRALWLIPAGVLGAAVASAATFALPGRWLYRSPLKQPYGSRASGALRLSYFTALLVALGLLRWGTDGRSTTYFFLLWVLPMATSFTYYLLLRDVYQHANADDGRLTNTRVFDCDPVTRWAILPYGQDMHLPHHLFPSVPQARLVELHRLLLGSLEGYAATAVECRGTLRGRDGRPSVLDAMAAPRAARGGDPQHSETAAGSGSGRAISSTR